MTTNNVTNEQLPPNLGADRSGEEEQPEELGSRAWVTLGLFAALIVGASGCFIGMFL